MSEPPWMAPLDVTFTVCVVIDFGLWAYCTIARPSIRPQYDKWNYVYGPVYALMCFMIAVGALIAGEHFMCALFSFYALISAWNWWNNNDHRRRRKKLRKRIAERVSVIAGRIRVVRPQGA